jgi:hypothetical protein
MAITDWLGHDVMAERFVKTETGSERIDHGARRGRS